MLTARFHFDLEFGCIPVLKRSERMTVFTTEPGYALFCSLVANGPFALSFGCWVCSALVFFRGCFCLILLYVLFIREGQTQRGAEAEAGE